MRDRPARRKKEEREDRCVVSFKFCWAVWRVIQVGGCFRSGAGEDGS